MTADSGEIVVDGKNLGSGSDVFRGIDRTGRRVVVKIGTDDSGLAREAELIRELNSDADSRVLPHIAPTVIAHDRVTGPAHLAGRPCLIMRDHGQSLQEVIDSGDQLTPEQVDDIANSLLTMLGRLEDRDIAALQLSAHHILIDGDLGRPVLVGWSGAWRHSLEEQHPKQPESYVLYPERWPDPLQTPLYLWALAVLVGASREAPVRLTGGAPGRTHERARDALFGTQPHAMASVVERCMAAHPEDRPQDAAAAQSELKRAYARGASHRVPGTSPDGELLVRAGLRYDGLSGLPVKAAVWVALMALPATFGFHIGTTVAGLLTNA